MLIGEPVKEDATACSQIATGKRMWLDKVEYLALWQQERMVTKRSDRATVRVF